MAKYASNKPTPVTKPQPIEINEGTPVERLNGSRIRNGKNGDPSDAEEATFGRGAKSTQEASTKRDGQ